MTTPLLDVLQECTAGSDTGRLTFPQVVMTLIQSGIERYHADLCRHEKTYYLPTGESHRIACAAFATHAAVSFDANGVAAAVTAIQRRDIDYQEFCRRILQAGCVGYQVSLTGRRAVYYGRTAESHIELFPPR